LYRPDSGKIGVAQSGLSFISPDLLTLITKNGFGGETTIEYTPSSKYINKLLPFVLYTTSSITVKDGLGNDSSRSFAYEDGLFNYATREFRGFETVTQTNPNGTTVKTWFHQDEYKKGKQDKVGSYEYEEGPRISVTDFTWDTYDIGSTAKFVYLDINNTKVYENDLLSTETEMDYTYVYDNAGIYLLDNEKSTIKSEGAGEDVTSSYEYKQYGGWVWRKTKQTVTGSISGIVRESYYDHDGNGNLRFEEHWSNNPNDPKNPVTEREYYANGNLWKVHDPKGNLPTVYEYDAAMQTYPVKITNPLGHIAEYQYDYRFGKVSAEKDPNGNWTYYDFDPFGRVKQVDFPDGGRVTTDYFDYNLPRLVVTKVKEDTSGSTIDSYQYFDGLGRKIVGFSPGETGNVIVTKAHYDNMGRNYRTEGPFFHTGIAWPIAPPSDSPYVETTFDKRGRPIEIKTPLGQDVELGSLALTKFSYSGFSTTVEDPDGGKKTEKTDYLGRVVQVTEYSDAGQLKTYYEYYAAGDLLKVTNALGNETTINYDSLGQKINMSDPDMGYWQYTYDANGNLETQIDADNQTITFDYDALNRVTSKSYSTGDPAVTYTYDEDSIDNNGIGRLYKVKNANAETIIEEYDEMGREEIVTRNITDAPDNPYTTTYSYDNSGRVKSMTYPDNYQVNYNYHTGTGLLETVTGITDFTEYAEFTGYKPTGKIGNIYHDNGTQTTNTYDPESTRLLSIQTLDPNLADIQEKAYRYTAAGDITKITDTKGVQNIKYNYAYDKLHRLISETNTGASDNFDLDNRDVRAERA
jgi:YD repeat-containing protein